MSEPLRSQSPHILFHVISRGNARQTIFRDEEDFYLYLGLLQRYKKKFGIQIYHFVLMSNHVHMLLEPTRGNTLSRFMSGLNLTYTKRFNKKYDSVGHVWQGRFRSIPIEADDYYLRCARYIELNPVRAKMVEHPKDYPWSSYTQSTQPSLTSWIDTHPLLEDFNKRGAKKELSPFQTFVESELHHSKQDLSETFSRLPVYGSHHFRKQFSSQL